MRHTMVAMAVAGLAASAWGQGVSLHFSAVATTVNIGDIVDWTVSASFTGYPDATAYFGGFVGSFLTTHPDSTEVVGYTNLMAFEGVTPTFDGGHLHGVNIFQHALFASDDPSNPIDIFTFEMLVTGPIHPLDFPVYEAVGIATVFPVSEIFTLGDEYYVPAPGSAALLAGGGLLATRRRR